jgi:hypothetical protein
MHVKRDGDDSLSLSNRDCVGVQCHNPCILGSDRQRAGDWKSSFAWPFGTRNPNGVSGSIPPYERERRKKMQVKRDENCRLGSSLVPTKKDL